jgi:hypothetical protein
MGAEGISSDTRDRRRKGLRIASSAPPALSLSKVQNSRNSLFWQLCSNRKLFYV